MSELYKLGTSDWVKGLVMTVISAVLALIVQGIQGGMIDWKVVGTTALVSGLTYILKQLGTDNQGKFLGKI